MIAQSISLKLKHFEYSNHVAALKNFWKEMFQQLNQSLNLFSFRRVFLSFNFQIARGIIKIEFTRVILKA